MSQTHDELQEMAVDEVMASLEKEYLRRSTKEHWAREQEQLLRELQEFVEKTQGHYSLGGPIGIGSTAVITRVYDSRRKTWLAAKIPRPISDEASELVRVIRSEADKLWLLDHPNVVRIYYHDTLASQMDFYVMDYVDGSNLADYCAAQSLDAIGVLRLARMIASGLVHLHEHEIVHCDLKPGNLLVDKQGVPRVADLGFSKFFSAAASPSNDMTNVRFTPRYAHPELLGLIKDIHGRSDAEAQIDHGKLRPEFDLYALGMSLHEIYYSCVAAGQETAGQPPKPTSYHDAYLYLIISRLVGGLDAKVAAPRGLTLGALRHHRYTSAAEVLVDIDRALGNVGIDDLIPELSPTLKRTVNIPGESAVPFTDRVEALCRHPLMYRLRRVRQLGFIDFIYPGGRHSRWEHSLGVFAKACKYLRALYDDPISPLFRSLVSVSQMKCVLLAALLHDVGQYPLAHDLEEVDRNLFGHDSISTELILSNAQGIGDFISEQWEVAAEDVASVLSKPPIVAENNLTRSILHSIVDGPLDVDKLDYLYRDSVHCGVSYGLGMDPDRLLNCLTTLVDLERSPAIACIGLAEKGRITAEVMAFTRYAMFAVVYWHHTYRAIKSMVRFAVGRAVQALEPELSRDEFREEFKQEAVLGKLHDQVQLSLPLAEEALNSGKPPDEEHLMSWITSRTDDQGRRILEHLEQRHLFRRVLVISPQISSTLFQRLSRVFSLPESSIEEFRASVETQLRGHLQSPIQQENLSASPVADLLNDATEVLCLLDLPEEHLTHDSTDVYYASHSFEARNLNESQIWVLLADQFNETVSRFRFFVHPALSDYTKRHTDRDTLESFLLCGCQKLSDEGKLR
jgi:HD superfamily phosphohydrolase